ncbi:Choline transporter-like protein 2 [Hondaea fermentalgiana]|uniref:Choline transporter-like protein 2 n=1 Tax=Hondaea fermentalgiana TaxID=2315210 RepID=A0A2R5GSG3_9STRA|nr:Choline transporter-like protein 2 [Hondaea fermentalgiana]|eukprot:GBG31583.1 Choline transporter-like protein 2 [Hondaea fermentalgiana]
MRGAATRIARLGTQRAQGTTRPIFVRRASSTTVDGRDKDDEGGSTVQRVTVSDSTGDDRLRKWEKRLEPALHLVTAQVDEALREIKELRTNVPTWVKAMEAVEKIAISKRKHLFRPQLVLLGFAAGSGQETWDFARELPEGLTAFAAGVELQHLFMFVHDDMMDNARTRRGHDTVHVAVAKSGRDSNEQTSRSSSSASSLRPSPLDPSSVQYLTTLVGDVLQAKSAALLASGERSMSSKGGTALPSAAEIVFAGALRAGAAQFDDILGWPGIERTLSLTSLDADNDNAVVDAEVSLMLRQIMDKASSHSFAAPLVGGLRLGAQVHPATSLDDLEECCLHWAEHAESAYLEYHGIPVNTMTLSSGEVVARPVSNEYCGTCLDPELDDSGAPMDPSSDLCKAKRTLGTSQTMEETPNPIYEQINTWTSIFTRWMGDITLCMTPILVSGGAVAIGLGCVWLVLLRFFAGAFVWISIWALLLSFAFLTVQFLIQGNVISVTAISDVLASITDVTNGAVNATTAVAAEDIVGTLQVFADQEESQEKMYRILGYIMLGITIFFLLLILTMLRKIRLAIGVLKEATKVVAAMPSILFFPVTTIAASLTVCIYAIYVSMLILSSGEITQITVAGFQMNVTNTDASSRRLANSTVAVEIGDAIVSEFASSNLNTWLFVYNFFGFLWTNQFIAAVGATTIAGAVSSWYWASEFEKEKRKKMPKRPVLAALHRTFRFHLGSLAFGAFVIAVVQLIRAALAYLDKQTQSLQKSNKVVKYVMKAVQCCLWCFEKILKFITKHAYIMIALKGSSFCTATRDGFVILLTNLAKIGVATAINNLMLLVAKLVITAGSGVVCWLYVTNLLTDEDQPSSAIVPVLVAAVLGWYVASSVLSVYALAVDTIMVCFCEDERRNDGSPNKPYYMSASLRRIARKSNKIHDKEQSVRRTARSNNDEDEDEEDDNKVEKKASEPTLQPKSPSKAPML